MNFYKKHNVCYKTKHCYLNKMLNKVKNNFSNEIVLMSDSQNCSREFSSTSHINNFFFLEHRYPSLCMFLNLLLEKSFGLFEVIPKEVRVFFTFILKHIVQIWIKFFIFTLRCGIFCLQFSVQDDIFGLAKTANTSQTQCFLKMISNCFSSFEDVLFWFDLLIFQMSVMYL